MYKNILSLIYAIDQKLDYSPPSLTFLFPIIQKYSGDDWKSYTSINPYNYTKIPLKMPPVKNDFDVYFITWAPGQCSPIHDHAPNGCILKVLTGTLVEQLYTKELELKATTIMNKGDIGYMNNNIGIHKICNYSQEVCVSLHIYSPSNYSAKTYKS